MPFDVQSAKAAGYSDGEIANYLVNQSGAPNVAVARLADAITGVESGGNPNAVSSQGARGSMQIMPGTFNQYAQPGESYSNDSDRRAAALRKINDDYTHFGGDVSKTAAAYIGGRGAVNSDGSIRSDVADANGTTPASYTKMVIARLAKGAANAVSTPANAAPSNANTASQIRPISFDVQAARTAGYSDGEIAAYLGGQSGFDATAAQKSGYSPQEIIDYLAPPKPGIVASAVSAGKDFLTSAANSVSNAFAAPSPTTAPSGAGRGQINPPTVDQDQPSDIAAAQADLDNWGPPGNGPSVVNLGRVKASGYETNIDPMNMAGSVADAQANADNLGQTPDSSGSVGSVESFARGYGKAGALSAKTLTLGAVAPAVVLENIKNAITGSSDTSAQDYVFKRFLDPMDDAVNWYSLKPGEKQSFLAKVSESLGGLVQDLPAMIASGGVASEQQLIKAVPTVAKFLTNAVGQGFTAMRPLMVKSGVEKAQQVLDNGGTVQQAVTSATTAAIATGFTGSQPMSSEGALIERLLTGIPVGAATSEGHRIIQNAADPKNMQAPFSWENVASGAVTNALTAGAMGHAGQGERPDRIDMGYAPFTQKTGISDAMDSIYGRTADAFTPAQKPDAFPMEARSSARSSNPSDELQAIRPLAPEPAQSQTLEQQLAGLQARKTGIVESDKTTDPVADFTAATNVDDAIDAIQRAAESTKISLAADPDKLLASDANLQAMRASALDDFTKTSTEKPLEKTPETEQSSAQPEARAENAYPSEEGVRGDEQLQRDASDKPAGAGAAPARAEGEQAPGARPVNPLLVPLSQREAAAPREGAQVTYTDRNVTELPVAGLKLSGDVPQFKEGADANGITQRLEGKYDRALAAPIQVWERLDGSMEVISGRHRLDLAQRSGETTIPAQVHREADGFDQKQARTLDIELNVKDGRGKVKDYVAYFKELGISKEQAKADGLLNTAIGRAAYTISTDGSESLIAAHKNDVLTDEAAASIGREAPGNEALQNLGMKYVADGKSINFAVNAMRAAKAAGFKGGDSGDMFGFDDSYAKEAEAVSREATKQQSQARQQLTAIRGAAHRPELAKAGGVDVKDVKKIQAKIAELEQRVKDLEGFATNPEVYRQLRADAGLAPKEPSVASESAQEYSAEAPKRKYTDDKQLQLFLDSEPDPSQSGPGVERARVDAVRAVGDLHATDSILAQALSSDYAARQRVSLVGQKIGSTEDLAVLAQVYRDPRFETFRVIFTDDGNRVVSQVGLTSRLPGSATAIVGTDLDGYLRDLSAAAKKRGATAFYMLHNHPSGSPNPSREDLSLTGNFARKMPGLEFKDHIILDTNQYAVISNGGRVETHDRDFGQSEPLKDAQWGSAAITKVQDVVELARRLQVDENAVTLVVVDSQLKVKAITTLPDSAVTSNVSKTRLAVARATLEQQGHRVFAVGRDSNTLSKLDGMVVDAVLVSRDGTTQSLGEASIIRGNGNALPSSRRARLSPDTSADFEYLRPLTAFKTAGQRVAENEDLLTSYGRDDILDQQKRDKVTARAGNAQKKAQDEIARRDQERKDIAARSVGAADTFELGGDANQNLNGQGALFARNNPFYSALSKEVDGINAKSMGPGDWGLRIDGLVKSGKVKRDEVEWSGLNDWLKLQTGRVSKEQVKQFLDANGVQVTEMFDRTPLESLLRAVSPTQEADNVRATVDNLAQKWNLPVKVVQTPADLPIPAPSDARGLYLNGEIYVVASNNPTKASVLRTLAHEAIAHHGLREMLGRDGWKQAMGQIQIAVKAGNPAMRELSDYIRKTYVDENGKFNLSPAQEADEIAAKAVEDGIDPVSGEFKPGFGWLKSVFAKVAQFLRDIGITVPFSNRELQGMLVAAQRNLETGERTAGGGQAAAARGVEGKLTDLQALERFWINRTWDSETDARDMVRRRIVEDNERYPMFKAQDPALADQLQFTRAAGGKVKIKTNRAADKPATPNPFGQHEKEGDAPKVDWDARDNADLGTSESIMKKYGRGTGRIYQAWVSPNDLPDAKGEDIHAGRLKDESVVEQGGRGEFPPIKVRITARGKVELMDGNHRLAYWRERGYDTVPAYVIDERPEPGIRYAKGGTTDPVATNKVVGNNQGGRSADDISPGVAALQAQLAKVEARYDQLRKRRLFEGPEWGATTNEASAIRKQLTALTGDAYGLPKTKAVKPPADALSAEYASPDQVPADVRRWVQQHANTLTSDATDAVRWGRIGDTLSDDRYPAGDLTIYRAVADGDAIRPGDWVTTERKYAEDHLARYLNGKGSIFDDTVDGRDVLVSPTGNSEEAIYAPRKFSGPVSNESPAPDSGGAFARSGDQTQTPAFKAWFGKSRITEDGKPDGKPLVIYRGEGSGDERNTYSTNDTRENAIFMTPDRNMAAVYEKGGKPREFYVQADRVLDLTQDTPQARKFITKWAKNFDEWIDRQSGEKIDPVDAVLDGRLFDYEGDWSAERWRSLQAEALTDHDAAYLPDWDNTKGSFKALIVKGGSQIKSATGNNGAFDANNPDIRFARAADKDLPDEVRSPGASMIDTAKGFGSDLISNLADTRAVREATTALAPMSTGTQEARAAAQKFANAGRVARFQWQRMAEYLTKTFTPVQREAMWNAADEQNVTLMQGQSTAGKGLDTLTPAQRSVMNTLHNYSKELWSRAVDAGMVEGEGLPFWTPRMAVLVGEDGTFQKPTGDSGKATSKGEGANVFTTASSLKQRKYVLAGETEAAMKATLGDNASMVRDILTMPMAMSRLEQAIAGRELVNQLKQFGQVSGKDVVSDAMRDGFVTIDHPAFTTYRPEFTTDADGKTVAKVDQNGDTVMQRVPLLISQDWAGPLKAVMSTKDGAVYSALMLLKSKAMTAIMFSPAAHNMVIFGRALAYSPARVMSLHAYFAGNALARDTALMSRAIKDGMVPIGANRNSMMDITDVARSIGRQGSWGDPNESWLNLSAQKMGNVFKAGAGDTIKNRMDAFGDFWHHTLLWKQVGALQTYIYNDYYNHMIANGHPPEAAGPIAAHLANRYGGAVANENSSEMVRKAMNLALFSRSFNMGNIGSVKDTAFGLPAGLKAKMYQDIGKVAGDRALQDAKWKARSSLVADLGMSMLMTTVASAAVSMLIQNMTPDDIKNGYVRRLAAMWGNIKEHPLSLGAYNPYRVLPTWDNEPDKRDRIDMGAQPGGRHQYLRLPTGKVVEDLVGWLLHAPDTFMKKASPLLQAGSQAILNDKGFGIPVENPDGGTLQHIAQGLQHVIEAQVPFDTMKTMYAVMRGVGTPLDKDKLVGFATGFTTSQGNPHGPEAAAYYQEADRTNAEKKYQMEAFKDDLKFGRVDAARARLEAIGLTPREIRNAINNVETPKQGLSKQQRQQFNRRATADEMEMMDNARR